MIIRKAKSKDVLPIIKVWESAGLPFRPQGRDNPKNLAKQMNEKNVWFLIAEEKKEVIGVVIVTHDSRKGWINRLAVHQNFKRQGIALKLIEAAEKSLTNASINVFAALIDHDNIASRRLFEKAGYMFKENITYYSKKLSEDL